jgi:hypothetical protein
MVKLSHGDHDYIYLRHQTFWHSVSKWEKVTWEQDNSDGFMWPIY